MHKQAVHNQSFIQKNRASNTKSIPKKRKSNDSAWVKQHPELLKCYTVLTNKGCHIYFNYNKNVNTTTDGFINFKNVDIRNNKSIA